jgi:hypothetical protein
MGFLDRFRKTAPEKDSPESPVFQEIISVHGLKKTKPYEPSLMQDWWEGYYGTLRFAVQEQGQAIVAYLGDIVEVTEIYLGRIHPGSKLPPESSPQRLDRIIGREGAQLAAQFVLLAHPGGDFDYPQLRLPELLHGIPRLSPGVEEIGIYENFQGLSLRIKHPISRSDFDNDLRTASEMVKALAAWADRLTKEHR